jgi:hypothetical protein
VEYRRGLDARTAVPFWEALDRGLTAAQALRVAIREMRQPDRRHLRAWGRRIAATLPEDERGVFVAEWTTRFLQVPVAPPGIDRWAPFMTIGLPGRIFVGTERPRDADYDADSRTSISPAP